MKHNRMMWGVIAPLLALASCSPSEPATDYQYFGEDAEKVCIDQLPPLFQAILAESMDALKEAIEKDKASIDLPYPRRIWAMFCTTDNKHDDRCIERDTTPLLLAAQIGNRDAAKMLIDAGASLTQYNEEGCSALHYAVINEDTALINLLIDKGINVDIPTVANQTFDVSPSVFREMGFETLEDYREAIAGRTPLHSAVSLGRPEILELLVARGASIEASNNLGWTALHDAASLCQVETIETLIRLGANTNAKTKRGELPSALIGIGGPLGADFDEKCEKTKALLAAH